MAATATTPEGRTYTLIDVCRAEYCIHIDPRPEAGNVAVVCSRLVFTTRAGVALRPLFDLVPHPAQAILDGVPCETELLFLPKDDCSDEVTPVRSLSIVAEPGRRHTLELWHSLDHAVELRDGGVELRFAMDDLASRANLERYLPCNVEIGDEHVIGVKIRLADGVSAPHALFASGHCKRTDEGWTICGRFRSSSLFLHLLPEDFVVEERDEWDGISIQCYADRTRTRDWSGQGVRSRLRAFCEQVKEELRLASEAFGPYPKVHRKKLVVHVLDLSSETPSMEYQGAIEADEGTLRHEIAHLWFGRSACPKGVDDLWIDEAIASWYASGEPELEPSCVGTPRGRLGARPPHDRRTPVEAYGAGERVIAAAACLWSRRHGEPLRNLLQRVHKDAAAAGGLLTTEQLREVLVDDKHASGADPDMERLFHRYVRADAGHHAGPHRPIFDAFDAWRKASKTRRTPMRRPPLYRLLDRLYPNGATWRSADAEPADDEQFLASLCDDHRKLVERWTRAQGAEGRGGAQPLGDGTWVTLGFTNGMRTNWGINIAYIENAGILEWLYGEVHLGRSDATTYEYWEKHRPLLWQRDSPSEPTAADRATALNRATQLWSAAKARHGFPGPLWLYYRTYAGSGGPPPEERDVVLA